MRSAPYSKTAVASTALIISSHRCLQAIRGNILHRVKKNTENGTWAYGYLSS